MIADLSTYNVNAAFELGIRYGLRPRATIIVAEEQFKNPFDVGHLLIRRYKHLGEDVGAKEAKRFGDELKQAIAEIMAAASTDSPVYTFLPDLQPPLELAPAPMAPAPAAAAAEAGAPPKASGGIFSDLENLVKSTVHTQRVGVPKDIIARVRQPPTAKWALDEALACIRDGDFVLARPLLEEVKKQRPNDSFVVQQLALTTFRAQQPSPEAALQAAKDILRELAPATTNDPETLRLWAAIHERLWQLRRNRRDLDTAIDACERGFLVRLDCASGANLARLLELRAVQSLEAGERDESTADIVLARRVRSQVVDIGRRQLADDLGAEQRFGVLVALREVAAGLGDMAAADGWWNEAQALEVPEWLRESGELETAAVAATRARIAQLTGH